VALQGLGGLRSAALWSLFELLQVTTSSLYSHMIVSKLFELNVEGRNETDISSLTFDFPPP
jgi:hypothetical protein